MLTAHDIKGVCVMAPTPCREGADGWDVPDSVDYEDAASMTEKLIRAGVGSIALLWDEKRKYVDTVVQVARKRVPILAGATALGTKEVARQMRGLKEVGADAAFVGLPLWQTPTIENSVRFFQDLSQAVPDMAIMIYSNAMFFKSNFPTPFWEGLAHRAPTVVATKVTYPITNILEDVRLAGHQINFLPGEGSVNTMYRLFRDKVTAAWSTSASMGPEPWVALMEAIGKDDEARVQEILLDMRSVPAMVPPGEFEKFPQYNAQVEKARFNAAGFISCGPPRAPFRDMPASWAKSAEAHGKGWAEMRKKYMKTPAS